MKYQRVLYTKNFTAELKAKLRILSYDKRRSLKGNVYYVSFASDTDIKFADRACKRLHNVTLKPFRSRSSAKAQCEHQFKVYNNEKSFASSSIPSSSSLPMHCLAPPRRLTFLSDNNSSFNTKQSDSLTYPDKTLQERAMRVLGPCIESKRSKISLSSFHLLNLIHHASIIELVGRDEISNRNEKQQLIDNVKLCLNIMKAARKAANNLSQLYSKNSIFKSEQKKNDVCLLLIENRAWNRL
mgnify:CR=1 FL=1